VREAACRAIRPDAVRRKGRTVKTRIARDVATARRAKRPIPAAGTAGWAQAEADRARIRTVLRAPPDWRASATTSVPAPTGHKAASALAADRVMRMPAPEVAATSALPQISRKAAGASLVLQRKCARGAGAAGLTGECEECSENEQGDVYEHEADRLAEKDPIQAKLVIGHSDDPLERDADRVADQVMRMPDPAPLQLGRKCTAYGEEDAIHRKAAAPHAAGGDVPALVHDVLRAPGKPLDPITRAFFEPRLGRDLGNVRVSADAAAARSAAAVGARAYTVGRRIAFAAGEYVPGTSSGRSLLAHELAHVVQQSGGGPVARPAILQRAPDKYDGLTIDQLRKLVSKGDKRAAEALYARYEGMTTAQLAPYARGSDDIARDVYARRTVPPKAAAGQGSFSKDGMRDQLTKDISNNRTATGIRRREPSAVTPDVEVEGGTVGAARTDIPGLDKRAFIGQSKRAGGPGYNPKSSFQPATNVKDLPHTVGHAEQHIADQLEEALAKIPREQLKGRTVWMLIEQEPCATCAQGAVNSDTVAGVLKKLSQKYPELTFEVKSLQSSALIVLKGTGGVPPAAGGAAVPHVVSGGTAAKGTATVTEEVAQGVGRSGFRTAGRFLARETPGLILQLVVMALFPPGVNIHNDKFNEINEKKFGPAVQDALVKQQSLIDQLVDVENAPSLYANVTARLDFGVDASSSGDLELTLEDVTFLDMKISNEHVGTEPKFNPTGSRHATRQVTYSLLLYESPYDERARKQKEYEECVREHGTGYIPPAAGVEAAEAVQPNPEEGPCIPPH
jgi:hypothetical protein